MSAHPAARFLSDERGLETVEYAVLAGLVVAGLVAVVLSIRVWVTRRFRVLTTATTGG